MHARAHSQSCRAPLEVLSFSWEASAYRLQYSLDRDIYGAFDGKRANKGALAVSWTAYYSLLEGPSPGHGPDVHFVFFELPDPMEFANVWADWGESLGTAEARGPRPTASQRSSGSVSEALEMAMKLMSLPREVLLSRGKGLRSLL